MNKFKPLLLSLILLISCGDDNDDNITIDGKVSFVFTHNWDEEQVSKASFNTIQYTNAHGEELSIERLRYLISNIIFHKSNGEIIEVNGYKLIDVSGDDELLYSLEAEIPKGIYSNVSFTFGFDNEDNVDGNYADLNSVLWNVPSMLGGGYHYMQLEGKFIDDTSSATGYQFHAIRAVDISGSEAVFQDTFFNVDLGEVTISDNSQIEINMNIAAWFKNPNTWNLNELHAMLMPNFNAQVMISENGQDVFSLGGVTP